MIVSTRDLSSADLSTACGAETTGEVTGRSELLSGFAAGGRERSIATTR
jgi:hypothetical protein